MKILHPRPATAEDSLSINRPRAAVAPHPAWRQALATFVLAAAVFMLALVAGGLAIMIAFGASVRV